MSECIMFRHTIHYSIQTLQYPACLLQINVILKQRSKTMNIS